MLALNPLWKFVSHQYFSIEITKKLEVKMHSVSTISKDEFSLFIKVFALSVNIADYWYRACVSVINGTLLYGVWLCFVKSSCIVDIPPEYEPPVPGCFISSFLFFVNPLIFY